MIEIDEIQQNYERFDDVRIIHLAKNEVKGLREEVIPILIAEIEKRELNSDLIDWIRAGRRKLTKSDVEVLKHKIRKSICENCKINSELRGYEIYTITGILIDTLETNHRLIICEKCGKESQRKSTKWTLKFGWWSLKGLFWTPLYLITRLTNKNEGRKQSEKIIEDFLEANIVQITLKKDSKEVIQACLKRFNHVEGLDQIN